MKKWQVIAIAVALTVLVFVISIIVANRCGYSDGRKSALSEIKTDTVVVTKTIRDTVRYPVPKYITKRVVDTLRVPVAVPGDTVFVSLPKEQRYYEDADYQAWVSGYQPQLDSVNVFPTTTYIEKTVTVEVPKYIRKRWGIGVQAGYGIGATKNGIVGVPYVGIGVSYNLLQW